MRMIARTVAAAAGAALMMVSVAAVAQQPTGPAATAPSSPSAVAPLLLSPEERQKREEWQRSILRIPAPKRGCFSSSYPSLEWHEVPCGPPPVRRYL
jgi:hypothetical protein